MSHFRTNTSEIILCDPCLFDDTKTEATGFCWICVECLCPGCIKEHSKVKLTRSHTVQRDIPENADALKEVKAMLTCPNHATMDVSFHCEKHDVYVCALCRVGIHKDCENIHEIAKGGQSESLFSEVEGLLSTTENALKETRKGKKENIASLYENQEQVFKERQMLMQQLLDESNNDTKAMTESLVKEIEKDVKELDVIELSKIKYKQILDAASKIEDHTHSNILANIMVKKVKSLGDNVFSLQKKERICLQISKKFKINQLKPFGEVDIIRNAESIAPSDDTDILKRAVEISSDAVTDLAEDHFVGNEDKRDTDNADTTLVQITSFDRNMSSFNQTYNIASTYEKHECSIQGIAVLQNGQFVLIDYLNLKIKLFANDFKFLSSLKLPGRPVRICTIGQNAVAVSFYIVKRINRYSSKGYSLVYEGGFNIRLFNRGIAYDGTNILAVMSLEGFSNGNITKTDEIEINVINPVTGDILDTIRDYKGVKSNWNLTLKNPMAIHVTDDNDIIIAEANRILCLTLVKDTLKGKTVAHEKKYFVIDKELPKQDIENIASDKGSLYVISDSGALLQLSNMDYKKRRILTSGLGTGRAVAINGHRILVGCDHDDNIHEFELQ